MPKYRNLAKQNDLSYIRVALARNIHQARRNSGMTQEELTFKAGISRTTLANIEGYRQSVTLELLYSLSDALQISVCDLLPANKHSPKNTNFHDLSEVMPDYFTVAPCRGCGNHYPEAMLNAGLCGGCDISDMDMFDQDDYDHNDPNTCSDCGSDTVQVQNGDWVCPDCDLWL